MIDVPLVGISVATVDEFHSVPFQNSTNGTVKTMNGRDAANDDVVFVIDHFDDAVESKLGHSKLSSAKINHAGSSSDIPLVHLLHSFHAVFRAELRFGSAWPPNWKWNQPARVRLATTLLDRP